MVRRFVASAAAVTALTGGAVTVGTVIAAAPAVASCHAHKVSGTSHWTCVTPGSYCPAAAHSHYGYAAKTGKRYKCVKYSNGRWRWKRA